MENKVYFKCFEVKWDPLLFEKRDELGEYYGLKFDRKKTDFWLYLPELKQKNSVMRESVLVLSAFAHADYHVPSSGPLRRPARLRLPQRHKPQVIPSPRGAVQVSEKSNH